MTFAMRHRITVRNIRPYIEEGHRYLIFDPTEQPNVGDYHIEVELNEASDVKLSETYLTIRDLETVTLLGAYEVAF